ncbi:MAG: head GIN domain-containing protein [Bacteroidota bacterium]
MKSSTNSRILSIATISALLFLATSCRFGLNDPYPIGQSNEVIEQQIPLNNFDAVEIGNAFKVFIRKGNNFSIIAHGDRLDVQELESFVTNGQLKIKYKKHRNVRFEMSFYITMPYFKEGNFYGASYAEIDNFNENKISLELSGASTVFVNSDAKNWDVDLSNASILELLGQGRSMVLDASGASKLRASKLFLNEIDLQLSGASLANVFADNEIIGRASGGSGVSFRGNPFVDIQLSGASWVERE